MDITECMTGEQMPGWYIAHAQDNLNLRILRMFEGTFSSTWLISAVHTSLPDYVIRDIYSKAKVNNRSFTFKFAKEIIEETLTATA